MDPLAASRGLPLKSRSRKADSVAQATPMRRGLSYSNVVATLALVLSMGGGAFAATHYVINSTAQINPRVLRELKGSSTERQARQVTRGRATREPGRAGREGREGPRGPEGAPGSTVVDRARWLGSLETQNGDETLPLGGASWTQGATEADTIVASLLYSAPPRSKCTEEGYPGGLSVKLSIDGTEVGHVSVSAEETEQTDVSQPFDIESPGLPEPGAPTTHTLTATVSDTCGEGGGAHEAHFVVEALHVDVLGAR